MIGMPKLGIVTVLYNSEKVLKEFFESLDRQTFRDFTLYVIDNASPDGSLREAERLSRQVSFPCMTMPQPENWGVAKGNNLGIEAAMNDGCELILLSNNDVVLNDPDTLRIMVDKMTGSDIDILCPKINYYAESNRIWAAGGDYTMLDTCTLHYGRDEIDRGQCEEEKVIRYTPTCFAMIKTSLFRKIGIMDEWYFVYYDDTDFMYRAWKSGAKIVYTPATMLLHNESVCTGKGSPFKHYYLARNQLYFIKKNRNMPVFLTMLLYRTLTFSLLHRWTMEKPLWKAELKGLREGFKASLKYRNTNMLK